MTTREKPRDLWTDEEFISAYGEAAMKLPWPFALGALQRPGWSGKIRTYLIWCRRCRLTPGLGFTVAHLAGNRGRLECKYCCARHDQLLPLRRLKGALINPLSSPRMIAFLFLVALLTAFAASNS
jgi:hypothetical protein